MCGNRSLKRTTGEKKNNGNKIFSDSDSRFQKSKRCVMGIKKAS